MATPDGKVPPGATVTIEEQKGPFVTITREYSPGDAGYEEAEHAATERGVVIPMREPQ